MRDDLRDLAADAAALADALGGGPAHLAGIGVSGMVAQVAALDHPDGFSALTLAGTRPVAPGRLDGDLPDHDAATMDRLFSGPMPDWSDRTAVAEFAAAGAEILGDDPAAARATAERKWDRTPGTEPAVQMANQMGMVFSKLNCKPRWRERRAERVGPGEHGRAAREQNERRCRVAEVLDPERDAIRVDRGHRIRAACRTRGPRRSSRLGRA